MPEVVAGAAQSPGGTAWQLRLRGGLRDRLHLGFLVDGDLGQLAVVALQSQCLLMTVRGFAPHLDAADRAATLVHDHSLDLRQPPAMADAHVLGDAES